MVRRRGCAVRVRTPPAASWRRRGPARALGLNPVLTIPFAPMTKLLQLTALLLLLAASHARAASCPDGARPIASPRLGEACPKIGRMGQLTLAVPLHYILGPDFAYEGQDIWKPETFRNAPE